MLENVEKTVYEILARHAEAATLQGTADATDLANLGIDSAEMINVIIAIEDAFDIEVEDEHIHRLRTVADIVRAVEAAV